MNMLRLIIAGFALSWALLLTIGHAADRVGRSRSPVETPGVSHRLYALTPGPVVTVYDIDHNFEQIKRISISAGTSSADIRGAVASRAGNSLYITYGCTSATACSGFLMKYDLLTDKVIWNKGFLPGVDSLSISPNGKTLYVPTGEGDRNHSLWYIVDAATGTSIGAIESGVFRPHNTVVSNDGAHIYMGAIGRDKSGDGKNFLVQADAATHSVLRRIGPVLNNETRPFTIDAHEQYAFIVSTGLNGFQVGSIPSGKILYTVRVSKFTNTNCNHFVTCSHGISLSPNNKEIYVVDYYHNYVHVFDVSGLPSSAPVQVADIALEHPYTGSGDWLTHSRDGRFVFVGQSGDVIDTAARQVVGYIPALHQTKIYTEIDFENGVVRFSPLSRSGVGYDN